MFLRRDVRADEYSRSLGATIATDIDEALALQPDMAIVANPSHGHAELVLTLLKARMPMYVEKPVATDASQIAAIRGAMVLQDPPTVLCGCNLRFLPALQVLRGLLRDGRIGRVVRATFQVGQWLPSWRPGIDYRHSYSARRDLGGGVVLDLVHELDAALWLLGELDVAAAVGGHCSSLEIHSEDAAWVLLSRPEGPVVAVGLDYIARRPLRRYEFIGEDGTLVIDLISRSMAVETASGIEPVEMPEGAFDIAQTYRTAMTEFMDAMARGSQTSQDLAEGLRSAELAVRANGMIRQ